MVDVEVVGPALAKSAFQVHGVGADGGLVIRRRLRPSQVPSFFRAVRPCHVGTEACASARHWAANLGRWGTNFALCRRPT